MGLRKDFTAKTLIKKIFVGRLLNQPKVASYNVPEKILALFKSSKLCWIRKRLREYRQGSLEMEFDQSIRDFQEIQKHCGGNLARCVHQYATLHKPLAYITRSVSVWGIGRLTIAPPILIPRLDTELWVQELIKSLKAAKRPLRILEIGTGSGLIALLLARHLPTVSIVATDISGLAIQLARENMRLHLGHGDCSVIKWNVMDEIPAGLGMFDLIVSNPPYIPFSRWRDHVGPSVKLWESKGALLAPDHGTYFHKRILDLARTLVKDKCDGETPSVALEIDGSVNQCMRIRNEAQRLGFSRCEPVSLYYKRPRAVFLFK